MTMPALIHRNSGTPVADAATSTSLGRDYKPVRPGREIDRKQSASDQARPRGARYGPRRRVATRLPGAE